VDVLGERILLVALTILGAILLLVLRPPRRG
jgi:hypothetical protein